MSYSITAPSAICTPHGAGTLGHTLLHHSWMQLCDSHLKCCSPCKFLFHHHLQSASKFTETPRFTEELEAYVFLPACKTKIKYMIWAVWHPYFHPYFHLHFGIFSPLRKLLCWSTSKEWDSRCVKVVLWKWKSDTEPSWSPYLKTPHQLPKTYLIFQNLLNP